MSLGVNRERELCHRLYHELLQHNGSMPVVKATALLEEWAPGQSANLLALGNSPRLNPAGRYSLFTGSVDGVTLHVRRRA
jgi:hypothetical protein